MSNLWDNCTVFDGDFVCTHCQDTYPLSDLSSKAVYLSDIQDCADCEGEGWYDCPHCGQEMDCEFCKGRGYFKVGPPSGLPVIGKVEYLGEEHPLYAFPMICRFCEKEQPTTPLPLFEEVPRG